MNMSRFEETKFYNKKFNLSYILILGVLQVHVPLFENETP